MEFTIIGFAMFFSIAFIKWKFDRAIYLDDALMLGVMFLFSGSYGTLVIGAAASALVSIYLLISPPKNSLWM